MKTLRVLALIVMAASAAMGTLYYDGGSTTDKTSWHDPVNWQGDVLPSTTNDNVDIENTYGHYSGAINTTNAVTIGTFLMKDTASTLTIGANFRAANFSVQPLNNRAVIINVANAGTTLSNSWAQLGSISSGDQYWRMTMGAGTVWDIAYSFLRMRSVSNSVNYCGLTLDDATINITGAAGCLNMIKPGSGELRLTFQNWNGQINILNTKALQSTLAGNLIIANGVVATNSRYDLIHNHATSELAGGFDNVTFGSTTCTNSTGDLYRLDLAALDGDGVNNDVVLNLISKSATVGMLAPKALLATELPLMSMK